jgi:hypothetical protein
VDTVQLDVNALLGTWRRFGVAGPVYEIIGIGNTKNNVDQTMRIRVIESGEELDYLLSSVLDDPREI